MIRKGTLVTLALAALVALPTWAAPPNRSKCSDISLRLIVAPQTPGMGGISGDGVSIYNNPNNSNDPFNGGTEYDEGVAFLVCNGSNDFVVNLRGTSPVRYLNLDFSVPLASPDTAGGAVDLTGQQLHQQGQQINEMANSALYSNGVFTTCSGLMLNPLSKTVTGGNAWFHPTSIESVQDCLGGAGPNAANTPDPTSDVVVTQVDSCTWTVTPAPDSPGSSYYRIGVAEVVTSRHTRTWVAGGQYQMPFSYKIQKLNCTP